MAEVLLLHGHRVRVVYSGTDAAHAVAEEMPDVILLDIGLPGIDGWDLARRIRQGTCGKQPLIIAVSGYCADGHRLRSADAGIDLHLAKPTDPAALADRLAAIRDLLSARELASQAAGKRH